MSKSRNAGILGAVVAGSIITAVAVNELVLKDKGSPGGGDGGNGNDDNNGGGGSTPGPGIVLIKNLTFNPKNGEKPLTVGFVLDVEGSPEVIEWHFGDGDVQIGSLSKTHVYFQAGTFNGKVKVTDKLGNSSQKNFSITVNESTDGGGDGGNDQNTKIISSFFQSAGVVNQNQFVGFNISVNEPFSKIQEIRWHYGDGSSDEVGSGNSFLIRDHLYSKSGTFSGFVKVKLTDGTEDRKNFSMIVSGDSSQIINANLILSGFSGKINPGESVRFFIDRSGGIPPYSYFIEYGDGSTSNLMDSTHSYAAAGDYTAKATVTDSKGNSKTTSKNIIVEAAPLQVGDVKFIPHPGTSIIDNLDVNFVNATQFDLKFNARVKNFRSDRFVNVKMTALVRRNSNNSTLANVDSTKLTLGPNQEGTLTGPTIARIDVSLLPITVIMDLDDASGELSKDLDVNTVTI